MAPVGTLWGASRQPLTKIIRSIAVLNALELEHKEFSFNDRPAEFTSKFQYGKVPAFEGSDGFKLVESAAIARYVCGLGTKVNLLGSNAQEIALVDQWVHFAEQEIGVPTYATMGMVYGFSGPFHREAHDMLIQRLVRALNYAESYLANRPSGYLVTDSVTLADLYLAGIVYGASHSALGAAERAGYPALFAHLARVTGGENVRQFWGTEGFTEVAVTEPTTFPH